MNAIPASWERDASYDAKLDAAYAKPDEGCVMLAEAEALQDADSICDWLGSNCFQKRVVTGYVPTRRQGAELSDKFYCWLQDHAQPHELLIVAMNHRAWADVAMGRLADMFVQDNQERINRRAKEMEQ